jgi:hypothetical protein
LQTIKIVITGGKVQSLEVKEKRRPMTIKEIAAYLRAMPKDMLADVLGIQPKERRTRRE